ncbi:hypothetical protein SLEP1_g55142 [Rubroshorea leprosula]|uniref:Uncharacterized protein n=1 Tax=Rubroshorea leprosula TaxID=152421 RepID=A0AAV5MHI2_9ROSI|nr:hypothetical protein SLEP1_g55142 [Rubroshorea leprosula]
MSDDEDEEIEIQAGNGRRQSEVRAFGGDATLGGKEIRVKCRGN